ncbi:MAG: DUF5011 domain-containing protein [Bacteroidetes bacterium]|nr:DUF5011 domain-containing protein [Bacteroidota bacterium]
MKRVLMIVAFVSLGAGMMFMSGCKKDDTTAPTITLTGGDVTINLGDTWVDPGYVANDDKDGVITSKVVITGTVDKNAVNKYVLTYTVSDDAGNEVTATRNVYVKAELLKGTYDVSDIVTGTNGGTYTYTVTVASSTDYNKLLFSNFGGFGATVTVAVTISGNQVTIPSQSPPGMPTGYEGVITGTGTYDGATKKILTMNYHVAYTAGGADDGNATYTKL